MAALNATCRSCIWWFHILAVPPSAERHREGVRESEGSRPAPDRGAAATPGGNLRWPTLQQILRDLGLTSHQVWGLTKIDEELSSQLEDALTAMRRDDLKHGPTAAYVRGCVCSECREHQRRLMARKRK
jgi:hypothetical protein